MAGERWRNWPQKRAPLACSCLITGRKPWPKPPSARRTQGFLIDINMGCPVKKIAKKGGGSGLIREPDLAARIVEAVSQAVEVPVTVKTRLGWCGSDADPVTWCQQLQAAGAQLLTLHGRTREQGFKGHADWQAIADVKAALQIPVIANGDINTPDDAQRCCPHRRRWGDGGPRQHGRPLARGADRCRAQGFTDTSSPDASGRLQLAKEQLLALVSERGDHGLLIARKHMGWTCTGFPGAPQLRHQLMRAPTPAAAVELLNAAAASVETAAAAS